MTYLHKSKQHTILHDISEHQGIPMTTKQRLAELIQSDLRTLTFSLIGDTPRIAESTVITVWLLGLNLTPKQVVELQPQVHTSSPTLTTVYKISSRFKDTVKLLKQEAHDLYTNANLL
ncbi:hypothetical protein ACVD55_000232 [Vibrio alginolyticus]